MLHYDTFSNGRHALWVMAGIAEHGMETPLFLILKRIAARQNITNRYLERIMLSGGSCGGQQHQVTEIKKGNAK